VLFIVSPEHLSSALFNSWRNSLSVIDLESVVICDVVGRHELLD